MPGPNPDAVELYFDTVALEQSAWGSHGVPRASSIGNDLLQQWFSAMHARYPDDDRYAAAPIVGESIWGMNEGRWQEPEIYQVLRRAGYSVHSVQAGAIRYVDGATGDHQVEYVDDESMSIAIARLREHGHTPFLTMHIDGIIEGGPEQLPRTLLELKKATMFSFGGMVQHGVRAEKRTYWFQASICAATFDCATARMMVFSRDRSATSWYFTKMRSANPIKANPSLYVEDIPVDPRLVQMADHRALLLLECIDSEKPPAPDPDVWPLNVRVERNGERTHLFPCGYCEHREPCLQLLREQGHDINSYVVVEDNRSKKEKEAS